MSATIIITIERIFRDLDKKLLPPTPLEKIACAHFEAHVQSH